MKLTKKIEKEIIQAYKACWDSYLRGDIKTFATYLDEDFKGIGTADGEVFFNKKEAVKFYKATAQQIAGKVEMRTRKIKAASINEMVLLVEQLDIFVLVGEEWIFYSKARITTLLRKKGKTWKFVQQHGSIPDTRTEEGEQLAMEKISAENLQLREAVKRRTAELESKNRELEIESSLERVRAVAMGMQQRADMMEICRIIAEQLEVLGVKEIRNVQTAIFYKDKGTYVNYEYYRLHDKALITEVDYTKDEISVDFAAKMLKGDDEIFTRSLTGKEVKDWYRYQKTTNVFIDTHLEKAKSLNYYWFSLGHVALGTSTYAPLNEDELNLFRRFRNVFELSYRRYLDIEKAEAQAREVQIELALERVRARTMSMQKSDELPEAANLLFQQVRSLSMPAWSAGYCIWSEDKKAITLWMSSEGVLQPPFTAPATEDPSFIHMREAWERGETFYVEEVGGEELVAHYKYMRTLPVVGQILDSIIEAGHPLPAFQIFHLAYFSKGFLLFITYEPVPESYDIFKRFATVFEQTYTRFLDLKKAEAQAKEAQIELSLERVRARAMAMHTSDELSGLVAILFEELTKLDLILARCIIWIFDKDSLSARMWMANSEDRRTAESYFIKRLHHPYYDAILNGWQQKKSKWVYDLQGENKKSIDRLLLNETELSKLPDSVKNGILNAEHTIVSGSFNNFGLIEASGPVPHTEEQLEILSRFGKVFDITYTRFLDLQKAEELANQAELDLVKLKEEKQRTEKALAELQVTQKQLIQSEKMASLGELTAGIAHEIQNPLNFVNNFSDVSNELIDEMMAEVAKGNLEEAKAIADDVKQNLEKINHHGKRADGIVKGMLQHSRASSGQKELTDINALADEYLRLAYHGLRAKDKTFNAKFETDFDPSVGKINIMPQDIGRVILNLINNAFYAVSEKRKKNEAGYEPTVMISTKRLNNNVEIKVKDNGIGIPQKVLDKIFQPFFTTKPTGQGTGLGLSLSYDIVKAHGGVVGVETTEGEGTEFMVVLPNSN